MPTCSSGNRNAIASGGEKTFGKKCSKDVSVGWGRILPKKLNSK
jgi:hypothetical protein